SWRPTLKAALMTVPRAVRTRMLAAPELTPGNARPHASVHRLLGARARAALIRDLRPRVLRGTRAAARARRLPHQRERPSARARAARSGAAAGGPRRTGTGPRVRARPV